MLQYLKIKNLALLEEVTLEFDSGFTAVTGETGAGKSVLLGALSLLSGGRSDKTMIRQGSDRLEVEGAIFFKDPVAINASLDAASLPVCEEGVLVLQRRIHREKMPRILINGSLSTLAQLRSLGGEWIDFHGPGEPQKLFKERCQLEMLDSYSGNANRLADYRVHFERWRVVCREIEALKTGERLGVDEIDFLREQINQIDQLNVSEPTVESLERDYARVANAQEFVSLAAKCSTNLLSEAGLVDQLSEFVSQYELLATLDSDAVALLERARSALIELQDLGEDTARLENDFEFDEEAVEMATERMNVWQEVKRKHGGSVEAVIAKRQKIAQKLASQGNIEEVLLEKYEIAKKLEKTLREDASEISKIRREASRSLAEKAVKLLQVLGFKNARLMVEFIAEPELKEFGDSRCAFQFSPNAGQALLPLNKIASSGETARVMLALKTILAEADATPLLVFDEVDANVGGEIGRSVGSELARLSDCHQILCVTHLPQVASLAKNHFVVEKTQGDESTTVSIKSIHENGKLRLDELARMLGDRNSNSARSHAKELLNA